MIKIIADSTCDLSIREAEQLGITLVPLSIHFGDETYLDKFDLSTKTFYEKLASAESLPKTSQANPARFMAAIKPYVDAGDEIIIVTLASKLSATMQSALFAAKELGSEHIYVVDSGSATFGAALLLHQGVRMRDEGRLCAEEIARELTSLAKRLHIFGVVDTLRYFKMGGRISATAAVFGTLAGIKPLIHVKDGVISAVGKVRTEAAGVRAMQAFLQEHPLDASLGVCLAHANCKDRMQRYREKLSADFLGAEVFLSEIGSVIGTHTGPGIVAISFFEKEH